MAGELARSAGVSTDTLRHYERKGVLARPRRSGNGYRLYTPDSLERVLLVRRAMSVGFTLDQLARVFAERDRGGAPCQSVHRLASERLVRVEEELAALEQLRGRLRQIIAEWDRLLAATSSGSPSRLLESLGDEPAAGRGNAKLSFRSKTNKRKVKE